MSNLTADYDAVVSIIAISGDVTVAGVLVSFALQTFVALVCILAFSLLRPHGSNRYIFQPRLEFAEKEVDTAPDPLDKRPLAWTKPIFKRAKGHHKVTRLGLDATMFLELNKYLFLTFVVLTCIGVPYSIFNLYFTDITGSSANNGIDQTVYDSVTNNGSAVVTPAPTATTTSIIRPSPTLPSISLQVRCGSSWANANSTCGGICLIDADCPNGLLCYRDVIACSNTSKSISFALRLESEASTDPPVNASLIVTSGLSSLTLLQIDTKSSWFWLPTALTWIFSIVAYGMLFKLCQLYVKHRRFYFTTAEFLEQVSHRTLLITYIPNIKTSQELVEFVHLRDPSLEIDEATINRNSTRLGKLLQEHKEKTKELEVLLTNIFETEDSEKLGSSVREETDSTALVENQPHTLSDDLYNASHQHSGSSVSALEAGHEPQDNYKFQSKTSRIKDDILKQLRTKSKTQQERADEVKVLESEINKLEEAIEAIRSIPEDQNPSNGSGFLSLRTPQQAHRLIKTLKSHPKYIKKFGGLHIKFAPEFPDIYWSNIGRSPAEIYTRRFFAVVITVAVTVGFIMLLGILSTLQNLTVLFQNNASALLWLQSNPGWQNFFQTFLCPIPVAICNVLLPYILEFITFLQGVKSGAGCDRSIIYKNYVFNMIQIFLFALISGMIQNNAATTSQLPTYVYTDPVLNQVVTAIESLAQNSYFYITMLASFYAGFGFEILQGLKLIISFIRRQFFKLTPRDEYELNGMAKMDFVQFYVTLVMAFTISLTFSIIAPFILPFSMLFFGITFVVMKYQLMYVYEVERETHGSFFPKLFNVLSVSVFFFQLITLLVVFAQNASTSYSPADSIPAFKQWMILAPLPIITALLWLWMRMFRIPQGLYCVDDLLELSDPESKASKASPATFAAEAGKDVRLSLKYQVFNHEFVTPLPRVLLDPKYTSQRIQECYTPRVRAPQDPNDPRVRAWALSLPSLQARKQDIAKRLLRGGKASELSYQEIQDLSMGQLEAMGGVPPESLEELSIQDKVAVEIERELAGNIGSAAESSHDDEDPPADASNSREETPSVVVPEIVVEEPRDEATDEEVVEALFEDPVEQTKTSMSETERSSEEPTDLVEKTVSVEEIVIVEEGPLIYDEVALVDLRSSNEVEAVPAEASMDVEMVIIRASIPRLAPDQELKNEESLLIVDENAEDFDEGPKNLPGTEIPEPVDKTQSHNPFVTESELFLDAIEGPEVAGQVEDGSKSLEPNISAAEPPLFEQVDRSDFGVKVPETHSTDVEPAVIEHIEEPEVNVSEPYVIEEEPPIEQGGDLSVFETKEIAPASDEPEIYYVRKADPVIVTSLEVDVLNPREHIVGKDHYVEYEVVSKMSIPNYPQTGNARRRYRDFDAFRKDLVYEFPTRNFAPIPPKVSVLFNKSQDVVEARRLAFASFLKSVAADSYIHTRSMALRRFLLDESYSPIERIISGSTGWGSSLLSPLSSYFETPSKE
ncbi:hypothetical protein BDR26DRAFT_851353 [Obelidium mucronatum]|nr:hypothetical protein BDR26DRAFT_851353 [Obelidium mucronatum]